MSQNLPTNQIHAEVTAEAVLTGMTSLLLTVMEFILAGMVELEPTIKQSGKSTRVYWTLRLWYEYGKAGNFRRNEVIATIIEQEVPVELRGAVRGDWARVQCYFADSSRYSVLNPATIVFGVLANLMRVFAKKAEHGQVHSFSLDQTMHSFVLINDAMELASKERNGFDKKSVAAVIGSMPSADTMALAILLGADQYTSLISEMAVRSFDEQPSSGAGLLRTVGLGPDLYSGVFATTDISGEAPGSASVTRTSQPDVVVQELTAGPLAG